MEFAKAFRRNSDGSWTCIAATTWFENAQQRIQVTPGTCFRRGECYMNVDVARWLDEEAGVSPGASVGQAGRN